MTDCHYVRRVKLLAVFILLLVQSCNKDETPVPEVDDKGPVVEDEPVINIKSAAEITFPDPFPVQPWTVNGEKFFYSTRANIMSCNGTVFSNSFTKAGTVSIDHGLFKPYIDTGEITVKGYWAKNVYRDESGAWHMVASPRIKNKEGKAWNVIAHLSPQKGEAWGVGSPIEKWVVDEILIGDPLTFDYANYAGKFYKDEHGTLFVIYVKRIPGTSKNGIFAQRMDSPLAIDQDHEAVALLVPGDFNSEYRNGTSGLKLLETGNVVEIEGKYVIAYTVGDYVEDNYKLGIAWSDDLTGPYKKMLKTDTDDIWKNGAGATEVIYFLQAQNELWPNYIKDIVKAPGVPSINQDENGIWYLFFAGLPPAATKNNRGKYNPAERSPYFVELNINIPERSVSETSAFELHNWITGKKR